jgi:hypothetical protein
MEQPKDDFERDLLARFASITAEEKAGPKRPAFAEQNSADGSEYRYFQPVFAAKQCLTTCHAPGIVLNGSDAEPSPFGRAAPGERKWNDGDLMAVVEVTLPLPLNER